MTTSTAFTAAVAATISSCRVTEAAYTTGAQYKESSLVDATGHYGAAAGTSTDKVPFYMPTRDLFVGFNGEEVTGSGGGALGDDAHLVTGVEDVDGGLAAT